MFRLLNEETSPAAAKNSSRTQIDWRTSALCRSKRKPKTTLKGAAEILMIGRGTLSPQERTSHSKDKNWLEKGMVSKRKKSKENILHTTEETILGIPGAQRTGQTDTRESPKKDPKGGGR